MNWGHKTGLLSLSLNLSATDVSLPKRSLWVKGRPMALLTSREIMQSLPPLHIHVYHSDISWQIDCASGQEKTAKILEDIQQAITRYWPRYWQSWQLIKLCLNTYMEKWLMFWTADKNTVFVTWRLRLRPLNILGDPGADSGGKRKSKRAEKYGTKKVS